MNYAASIRKGEKVVLSVICENRHNWLHIVFDDATKQYYCFTDFDWNGKYYAGSPCDKDGLVEGETRIIAIVPVMLRTYKDTSDCTAKVLCYEYGKEAVYALINGEAYGVFNFETEEFDFEDGGVFDNQEEFNEFVNSSNKWVDLLYEITYSTDDTSVVFHIGDMHRCMGSEYMC